MPPDVQKITGVSPIAWRPETDPFAHGTRRVRWRDETIGRRRPAIARRPRAGLASVAHVDARHRDRRERAAPLRTPGAAVAAERSVLVSGARIRDGDGLALLRHYHLCDGCLEARPQ